MSNQTIQGVGQKWVIVFLIYADFTESVNTDIKKNVRLGLNTMFDELLSSQPNPLRSRIVVIMDSICYTGKEEMKVLENSVVKYEIGLLDDSNTQKILSCTILHKQEKELGKVEDGIRYNRHFVQREQPLSVIFNSIKVLEEEEIFLITWDHGSAFGVFSEERINEKSDGDWTPFTDTLKEFSRLKEFRDFMLSDKATVDDNMLKDLNQEQFLSPEILTNAELANAFANGFGSKSVGVLMMMNCWMMNLHTLYSVRDQVKCIVACQGDFTNPGYNYEPIINLINKGGAQLITPQVLAENCVRLSCGDEARKRAERHGLNPEETIDIWILAAMDLSWVDEDGNKIFDSHLKMLKKIVNQIYKKLKATGPASDSIKYLLRYSRPLMYDYTCDMVSMIDFSNYLDALVQINNSLLSDTRPVLSDRFKSFIAKLATAIRVNDLILSAHNMGKPYKTDVINKYLPVVPTGFSLYFRRFIVTSPKVNYSVNSDTLLKDYLVNWQKVLDILFGKYIDDKKK